MASDNQWSYWQSALAGKPNRDLIQRGNPQSGYYSDRNRRGVAIWRDDKGELRCAVTFGYAPKHADEIDELFGFVCNSPITYAEYQQVKATGKFSAHVDMPETPGIGDNSGNRPLSEIIQEQIEEKQREFKAWMEQIGGKLISEAHADKCANFADVFTSLEKKADEARKAEKKPLDEQVKEVQDRWNPIVAMADKAKRYTKELFASWGVAEKRRREEEARKAREEAEAAQREAERMAEERGEAPPPPPVELAAPPEKVRVSAGTRGKVAMKQRTIVLVHDPKALLAFFAAMDQPPPELIEVAKKIATRMVQAGTPALPGTEAKREDYAA